MFSALNSTRPPRVRGLEPHADPTRERSDVPGYAEPATRRRSPGVRYRRRRARPGVVRAEWLHRRSGVRSKAAPSSGRQGASVAAGARHGVRLVPAVAGVLSPCGPGGGVASLQGDRSAVEPRPTPTLSPCSPQPVRGWPPPPEHWAGVRGRSPRVLFARECRSTCGSLVDRRHSASHGQAAGDLARRSRNCRWSGAQW